MMVLDGRTIALSVSNGPDRAKLGVPAREIERAMLSICVALVRAGAKILYGGDLRPSGSTFKIFRHLAGAYAGTGKIPFVHLVAEPVVRRTAFAEFEAALRERRGMADTLFCLGTHAIPVRWSSGGLLMGEKAGQLTLSSPADFDTWVAARPTLDPSEGYSAARRAMASLASGRVSLGGKMGLLDDPNDQYEGRMPGIVEEAILTLEDGKAFVPLGAFGGAARDVAIALGLIDPGASVPRGDQHAGYSDAMAAVAALRGKIPSPLIGALRSAAMDDRTEQLAHRTEQLAHQVRDILTDWRA